MKNIGSFITVVLFFITYYNISNAHPLRMAPYRMDTVRVQSGSTEITGVLCTSAIKAGATTPLVIIVPGSGPTDMDGNNIMGVNANSYVMLARDLAERGVSTFRYNKRGIDGTDKNFDESTLKFSDMVNDVKSIIAHFKGDNRFSKITILGHSEGSLIGMLAASSGVHKFISLAGPADNAATLLKTQLAPQLGTNKTKVFKQIDSLRKGQTVREQDPQMGSLFRSSVQPYLKSWFKYTPTTEIKKLKIPILIINGTKDLQVSEAQAKKLKQAQPKAKLLILKNMTHTLKLCEGDDQASNMLTYTDEYLPLVFELVEGIADFVNKK